MRARRQLAVVALGCLAGLSLYGALRSASQTKASEDRRPSQFPTTGSPAPPGRKVASPIPKTPEADANGPLLSAPPPEPPQNRKERSRSPDENCIRGRGHSLSPGVRRAIAQAIGKADVLLKPGDVIRLIRQGSQLVLYEPPPWLRPSKAKIQRLINNGLEPDDLPVGLHGVQVQCK